MESRSKSGIVLYVEDEKFDRFFMQMAFQELELGQALRMVTTGPEALDYLSGKGKYADREQYPLPSLLLLDLNLPAITGFEVLQWVRSQAHLQSLLVVMFSSSPQPEDKLKALKLGAAAYIEKPNSGLKFVEVAKGLRTQWPGAFGG
jgi:CheY-like chemotaxis protein